MRIFAPAVVLLSLSCLHGQAPKETVKEQFAKRAARLWSLQPVTKPAVPAGVTASTNPIDAFIAADYKAKGLRPTGKADKLTLLRRVYLDLIGLPPTPAEQEAFLADTAPGAYEMVVDRLLENEQHGVRWSRYWLDVLRYADLGICIGISFAILRRFWAVAARTNSSRAPFGPRKRKRSSLRMRLRCANSISIFLRSRREVRPSHDLAIWRAMSRAPS